MLLASLVAAGADEFVDDFSSADPRGWKAAETVQWQVRDGLLLAPDSGGLSGILVAPLVARDVSLKVDVRLPEQGRRNVALAFGLREAGTGYVVRWYDRAAWLELIRYEKGGVVRIDGNHWQASSPRGSVPQKPDLWYTMAVEAVGEQVRAKVWPRGREEPAWQLEAFRSDPSGGAVGLSIDQTLAQFDNFVARSGNQIADLLRAERKQQAAARHRRRSVVLHDGAGQDEIHYAAGFWLIDGVRTPPPEIVFRARDADNYYFARACRGTIEVGKLVAGRESVLATAPLGWDRGPGRYTLEARVVTASRDDRGAAWFINRDHVPPMVSISARVRPAHKAAARSWDVTVRDDPISPGRKGEPYWDLDPFKRTSAQSLMGARTGWRCVPGVRWLGMEVRPIEPHEGKPPAVSPVQTIHTGERGGCWLALGDLDGDEQLDYVVARNTQQAVTALTAYANDGRELWRWGDGGGADIGYDVPATVYDIDRDGRAEVLCSIEGFLVGLDGATGVEKLRWPLPEGLKVADCIIVANLRGLAEPADLLVKTRYDHVWAFTNEWEPLWEFHGTTGHHPAVADIDDDGKDEVLCGFTLIDDDGTVLWQQDLPGHADAARLVRFSPDGPLRALSTCCGGNDMALTAADGSFLWRQRPAIADFHFQSSHVGEVRRDVPGYEIVVDEGWARPGRARLALLDARGRWLGSYYVSYPRFHRLVDWDGNGVMELVIPSDRVLYDGRGQPVLRLVEAPPLGGPGVETPIARTADVCGDGRDELILYNAESIVIYANPRPSRHDFPPQPVVQKRYYNFTYY